jgi:hypothetical protein
MRIVLLLLLGLVIGRAAQANTIGSPRSAVLRDVEGYAIAVCLGHQAQPYLKEQGDGWASVVVQRGKAPIEILATLGDVVKREIAKGNMAVIRVDTNPPEDRALPVFYCGEIIDTPAVRAAIQKTVAKLKPFYRHK